MNRFFFLLIIVWINLIYSQKCDLSISGSILDLHDRSQIIGALIKIESTNIFSQTNLNGNYRIEGLCAGTYQITIQHPQCRSVKKKINLQSSQIINFDLEVNLFLTDRHCGC